MDVLVAVADHLVEEGLAADIGDGCLAGRVDLGQDEDIGLVEGPGEVIDEV